MRAGCPKSSLDIATRDQYLEKLGLTGTAVTEASFGYFEGLQSSNVGEKLLFKEVVVVEGSRGRCYFLGRKEGIIRDNSWIIWILSDRGGID
jgi:hypothetical protein